MKFFQSFDSKLEDVFVEVTREYQLKENVNERLGRYEDYSYIFPIFKALSLAVARDHSKKLSLELAPIIYLMMYTIVSREYALSLHIKIHEKKPLTDPSDYTEGFHNLMRGANLAMAYFTQYLVLLRSNNSSDIVEYLLSKQIESDLQFDTNAELKCKKFSVKSFPSISVFK